MNPVQNHMQMNRMLEQGPLDLPLVQATLIILFWFLLGLLIGYWWGRARGVLIGRSKAQREIGDVWADWKKTHPD